MESKKITVKTPLRISLTGGNDLIPYVSKYGGDAFAATIDKYVTVSVERRDDKIINMRYPDGEEKVYSISAIENPIIRQAFVRYNFQGGFNLVSTSDVPLSSGLGSSGAFAVGLLNALQLLKGVSKSPEELAEEACDLEINQLKSPIGKQDQYMAALGGFLHLEFQKDNSVKVNRVKIDSQMKKRLEDELLLVYSGTKRSATAVLSVTAKRFESNEEIFPDITAFREYGNQMRNLIISGNFDEFCGRLKKLSHLKRTCYVGCTNERLEKFIEVGYQLGATGAKILGAGGGGFVYFHVPKEHQKVFMSGISNLGGQVFPYSFVDHGSRLA